MKVSNWIKILKVLWPTNNISCRSDIKVKTVLMGKIQIVEIDHLEFYICQTKCNIFNINLIKRFFLTDFISHPNLIGEFFKIIFFKQLYLHNKLSLYLVSGKLKILLRAVKSERFTPNLYKLRMLSSFNSMEWEPGLGEIHSY
jgi:hypothetical protein